MGTWIVTGATRGLGRSIAERLLEEGHRVVMCARDENAVRQSTDQMTRVGPAVGLAGSIADPAFADQLVATAASIGDLEGIVLNAAVLGSPPLSAVTDLSPTDLLEVLNVNLMGNLRILKQAHPHLNSHPRPQVLSLTSDAAWAAYRGWAAYGLSKAALDLLVLTYSAENPAIRVFVVDPGDMNTRLHRTALPDENEGLREPEPVSTALASLLRSPSAASGRWRIMEGPQGFIPKEVNRDEILSS